MKKRLFLWFLPCLFSSFFSYSQNPGEWMWIHGSNSPGSVAVYGTKGVSSPTTVPPATYEPCEWKDAQGNLWIFQGYNGGADLWKYNPLINEWTWMKGPGTGTYYNGSYGTMGVSSPANNPPSKGYGAATWVDKQGNFWLFGGLQINNELWKYDPLINEWTWMKGGGAGVYGTQGVPNILNTPPARYECASAWTDSSNNLWLFGGYSLYSDLWRYNISTNEWTWMKGPNTTAQPGNYGTIGVEAPTNNPGARGAYSHWKDKNENLWLFGGMPNFTTVAFNDLWRYNPVTNNWTWMGGLSSADTMHGVYGTSCVSSPANMPGQHFENRAAFTDQCGNFWTFGGGLGGSFQKAWNDLWMYSPTSNEWTWVSGDTIPNPTVKWGLKGLSSPLNKMNGRGGNVGWTDNKGHIYLFGGGTTNFNDQYNDIWVYAIDSNCISLSCTQGALPVAIFTSSDTAFCNEGGQCIDFTDHSSGNPTSWQWLFPGAVPDTSSQQNPTGICYFTPGTYEVTLIVSNSNGSDTITVSPMITFGSGAAAPVLTFRGDTIFCSHAAAYQWYYNGSPIPGATDSFYVAIIPGNYSVMITDELGCSRLSAGVWAAVNEPIENGGIKIYPNPAKDQLVILSTKYSVLSTEIYNVLGEKVYSHSYELRTTNYELKTDVSALTPGIYFVEVDNGKRIYRAKFVKE